MARAMPVLPEVASISVSPGLMSPRASAWTIIDRAGRSLTEPAGLLPSSLARMTLLRLSLSAPGMRTRRTRGVFPTKSWRVLYIFLEPFDILGNPLFDRRHRCVVASFAQTRQISPGKGLIFALQVIGKRNVFQQALRLRFRQGQRRFVFCPFFAIDRSICHVIETARRTGTNIEDARFFRMVEEMQIDPGDIVNIHKIALQAWAQADPAIGLQLPEALVGERSGRPLVGFARAINVEVTQTDDLRGRTFRQPLANDLVEQELGIAMDVERRFMRALFRAYAAAAIYGGAGSIQELDILVLAPVEQDHGVTIVIFHDVATVGFQGIRTGALMEDGIDLAVEMPGLDAVDEIVLVEVIDNIATGQIPELAGRGQIVDGDDVPKTALVECLDDVGADEASRTGNDDIHADLSLLRAGR